MRNILLATISGLFLISCKSTTDNQQDAITCTSEVKPGIVVEIRDANSDIPLAENAVVVITDGSYSETLLVDAYEGADPSSAYSVAGAYERPGVYDISLTLTGYESWSRTQVKVDEGICHVNTVAFKVGLATAP